MQATGFVEAMRGALGAQLPSIVVAVALLLLGWIVALVAAAAVHRVLSLAQLNRRLAPLLGHLLDVEFGVSRLVFWFVLLVALAASSGSLDLQGASAPFATMVRDVIGYLPQLLAALVLALIGWLLALLVRNGLTRLLDRTTIDERLSAEAGMAPIGDSIGHVGYWVVLLLALPVVLGALGLQGLLDPVRGLFDALLALLPDLGRAGVVVVVGYYVAKIVRGIVSHLLVAVRVPALARSVGLGDSADLPRLAGMVVFFAIFVPALIAALDALRIESVAGPARLMLSQSGGRVARPVRRGADRRRHLVRRALRRRPGVRPARGRGRRPAGRAARARAGARRVTPVAPDRSTAGVLRDAVRGRAGGLPRARGAAERTGGQLHGVRRRRAARHDDPAGRSVAGQPARLGGRAQRASGRAVAGRAGARC